LSWKLVTLSERRDPAIFSPPTLVWGSPLRLASVEETNSSTGDLKVKVVLLHDGLGFMYD
jgi:hypothetical protein